MKKNIQKKFDFLIPYFEEHNPDAQSELHFNNSYELLIAVVLSAQCTDKRVNMVTPSLFEHYPTPFELAKASIEDIYGHIKSISYPNNKAKHLHGLAQALVEHFNGMVPDNADDLQTLPGVGRKTANVMLAVIFNQPKMAVDTHVFRVANRIGIVENADTPLKVELQLTDAFPADIIPKAHHWLILHGRYVCLAKKPLCEQCGLTPICEFFKKKNQ